MRCKKCAKTFRIPSRTMRETQICADCTKANVPTRNEEGSRITRDRFDTSAKWIDQNHNFTNNTEESNKITLEEIEYPKENTIQRIREEQIENHNKLVQINNKIEILTQNEKKMQEIIKEIEVKQQKKNEKSFSRLFNIISKKNEPVNDYNKILSETVLELEKIYSELNKKRTEQNICRINETKFLEKIEQLKNETNNLNSSFTKKPYETYEEPMNELDTSKEDVWIGNTTKSSGTCKMICNKFRVKKPADGGRYEAGQAYCLNCDTWIDYRGGHMKDGSLAIEDSVGWFCNCCNYRVRQKPRNKIYKEKLRDSIEKEKTSEFLNSNKFFEINAEKMNRLISDSLVLIRKNNAGIYEKTLLEALMITDEEFEQLIPRLLRIDDIFEEEIQDGDEVKKVLISDLFEKPISNSEISENQNIKNEQSLSDIIKKLKEANLGDRERLDFLQKVVGLGRNLRSADEDYIMELYYQLGN